MKELLQKLIQAESTDVVGELVAAEVLANYLQDAGIKTHINTWGPNRANCLGQIRGNGEKPALLFLCHLDVVPPGDANWKHPPFSGLDLDGEIYGRGATDMKGGTVAAAMALQRIAISSTELLGDVILAATAGEETDSCGVKRFMQNRAELPPLDDLAGVLIPEPTNFSVISAHRGLLWLEIHTHGKTAHGSMPHLGVNAIASIFSVIKALERLPHDRTPHPRLGSGSMSPNMIQGGKALNVVPDQCTLGIDIRLLPGQDPQQIVRDVENILQELQERNPDFQATVTINRSVAALETDLDSDFVKQICELAAVAETEAVGFTTDAPFAVPLNAPILIMGPGDGRRCHQPDESIAWTEVEKAADLYERIIRHFLT